MELVVDIVPDLPSKLYGDNTRIKQILLNLTNNAAKFTTQGKIVLKVDYLQTASDMVELDISVEDTGIGIPVEEQRIIFSRFYKQDEFAQGTGLGLSICQLIVEKSGGSIELWSEPSKGSRFTVVLPCHVVS